MQTGSVRMVRDAALGRRGGRFAASVPLRLVTRPLVLRFMCAIGYPTPPLQNRVVRICSASPAA